MQFLLLLFILFVSAVSITAQAVTAKYNDRGDLIWLLDKLPDTTGCERSRVFAGTLTRVEPIYNENNPAGFEFVLKPTRGAQVKLQISNGDGSIDPDLSEMLQKKRRFKVSARQCGSGAFWIAEEIWRLEALPGQK